VGEIHFIKHVGFTDDTALLETLDKVKLFTRGSFTLPVARAEKLLNLDFLLAKQVGDKEFGNVCARTGSVVDVAV